jgi:hypothetical protein
VIEILTPWVCSQTAAPRVPERKFGNSISTNTSLPASSRSVKIPAASNAIPSDGQENTPAGATLSLLAAVATMDCSAEGETSDIDTVLRMRDAVRVENNFPALHRTFRSAEVNVLQDDDGQAFVGPISGLCSVLFQPGLKEGNLLREMSPDMVSKFNKYTRTAVEQETHSSRANWNAVSAEGLAIMLDKFHSKLLPDVAAEFGRLIADNPSLLLFPACELLLGLGNRVEHARQAMRLCALALDRLQPNEIDDPRLREPMEEMGYSVGQKAVKPGLERLAKESKQEWGGGEIK